MKDHDTLVDVADVWTVNQLPNPWSSPGWECLAFDDHGWFGGDNSARLNELLWERQEATRLRPVVIEVGCWLGSSTRFLAERARLVIAIDHWLGSEEHQHAGRCDVDKRLPVLFEQFLRNTAHFRNICPIRLDSLHAAALQLPKADLVYLDGAHDFKSVMQDLRLYRDKLLPGGILSGDDWIWEHEASGTRPVQAAATAYAAEYDLEIHNSENFWWMLP